MNRWRAGATAFGACILLIAAGCASKTDQATTTKAGGETSTAPSGKAAANEKVALVRFVNAIPGVPTSLSFGDQQAFTDVAYRTVTPYKELPGERHDFKLLVSGQKDTTQPAATNSEGLTNGARYTVVASLDKNGRDKLDVITDNLSEPANGKAKVRVINGSEDEVDVVAPAPRTGRNEGSADRMTNNRTNANNEDKWFSGVNQASSTSYKDVDPLKGTLDVRRAGSDPARRGAVNGAEVPVDFVAGKLYTIVVTGGTPKYPLEVVKIEDELTRLAPRAQ